MTEPTLPWRDPDAVQSFLREHPDLPLVLANAYERLKRYFGQQPEVILGVVSDPDAPDRKQLYASVQTQLPLDDALDTLDAFLTEWFRVQPARIDKLLIFSADGR